jgi:hypothetical protein
VPEALLYGLAAASLSLAAARGDRRFPLTVPLAAFLAVSLASLLVNQSPLLSAASDFRTYFRFAAFTYVVSKLNLGEADLRFLFRQPMIMGGIQILVGASEILIGQPARVFFTPVTTPLAERAATWIERPMTGIGFISGTLSNYNHFGILMVVVCSLALSLWTWRRSAVTAGMFAAALTAAVLSYSRHTLLCMLAAVLILLILHKRRLLAAVLAIAPLAAAAIALLVVPRISHRGGPDITPVDRLMNTLTENSLKGDPAENVRLFFLLELPGRFLSTAPVLGMGPGAIAPTSELRALGDRHAAGNDIMSDIPDDLLVFISDVVWLVALGTYGIAGLLAIAYVFTTIVLESIRLRKQVASPEARLLAEVVVTWTGVLILAGFFSMEIIARDTVPVFWIFAGAVFAMRAKVSPWVGLTPVRPVPLPVSRRLAVR